MTCSRSHSQNTGRASSSNTVPLNLTEQRHRGKQRDTETEKGGGKRIEDRDKEGNRNDQTKTEGKSSDGKVRHQKIETIAHFSPFHLDYSFGLNSSIWGGGSSPRPAASRCGTGHPDILLTVAFLNDLH